MRQKGVNVIEFNAFKANVLAPTVVVDQVLGFYRIGPLVQVTYGFEATSGGGVTETVQGVNLLWTPQKLLKAREMINWALTEWRNGAFREIRPEDVGFTRPHTQ